MSTGDPARPRATGSGNTRRGSGNGRVDPTARIASRSSGSGRARRRPVIPPPEEMASVPPDGLVPPNGTIPNGTVPNGTVPNGTVPNGTVPPNGTAPNGAVPSRSPVPPSGSGDAQSSRGSGEKQSAHGSGEEQGAGDGWERRIDEAFDFIRRRITGEYEVDEFGFDREFTEQVLAPALKVLYKHWFRVEVFGIDRVPSTGSALLVANHSGTVAMDSAMLSTALLEDHPARRHLRLLGADFVFRMPLFGEYARKGGATLACAPDAERLLSTGNVVGVFPEGFKGVGKPFRERYKLQRFGRGGFVSAALRTGAPIVPVSIVGAEEIYPLIGDIKPLARLLGAPYFPVTPLFPWLGPLGMVPLPSKWLIEFGEPIDTAELADSADDPMAVFNLADTVRETIQQTLYRLLLRRGTVFG